jgi:predicted nucleic acid-binding protein
MRVVVDTNIAFSAILNTNSKIAGIILQPRSKLNFYSTRQLLDEIVEHWDKLRAISGYSDKQLHEVVSIITSRIRFINPELVPVKLFRQAEELTRDSDIDDTEFVALAEHIKGKLWTGDKRLRKGLTKHGWERLVTTDDLYRLLLKR